MILTSLMKAVINWAGKRANISVKKAPSHREIVIEVRMAFFILG